MILRKIILVLFFILFFSPLSHSNEIVLKSGEVIQGKILEAVDLKQADGYVKIETG